MSQHSLEVKAAVMDACAAGMTMVAAAAKYDVGQSTIQRWHRELREGPKELVEPDALTDGEWVICPRRRIQVWQPRRAA